MLILGSPSSSASYGFTSALKLAGATGNASPTASSFVASCSISWKVSLNTSLKVSS